ncbi:MAG: alpha/beta fold hydrolase [Pseudomarimonas sp.]
MPAAPSPMTTRLPRADGVQLAVTTHGPDAATPVLFTHGFGQTCQAWENSARVLAEAGYRSLLVDARGHGGSDWNPPDLAYSMQQFVDDLDAMADNACRDASTPPVLVGASMGGLIGMFSAARAPERFRALVLVDITPRWEADGVARILDFMGAHPDGFADYEHAAEAIAAYLPHRRGRKTPEQMRSLLVARADGRLRWHWDPRLLNQIARGGERYQDDLVAAARRVCVPTLLISGGQSDLVSSRNVDEFLQLVPHATHVQIAEATHMVAGDRNDQFTATILGFLTTLAAAEASTGASS